MSKNKYTCPYCITDQKDVSYICRNSSCKLNYLSKKSTDGKCKLKSRCSFRDSDNACTFNVNENSELCSYGTKTGDRTECTYGGLCPQKSKNGTCSYSLSLFGECVMNNIFKSNSGKCPECGLKSYVIVCPDSECNRHVQGGSRLPESSLNGDDIIISIVGSRSSGKSNYIGVLINELMHRICSSFDGASFEVAPPGGDSWKRYNIKFGNRLYSKDNKFSQVPQTQPEANPIPLLFSFRGKGRFNSVKTFTFVFFDTAGESFQDSNALDRNDVTSRYVQRSDAMIFLVDPLQLEYANIDDDIRKNAVKTNQNDLQNANPAIILPQVADVMRHYRHLKGEQKINIPLAIVFSKFDAVINGLENDGIGMVIRKISPHCTEHAFVKSDAEAVEGEVRGLLGAWGADSFMNSVDKHFTNYSYFVASAFGLNNMPDKDGNINKPNPHRIEDALLWILSEMKYIKSKK